MKDCCYFLSEYLKKIEDDFGGDVTFCKPISPERISIFEKKMNFKIPKIFKYFYEKETNGLIIDDKIIFPFYDKDQKKTFVDNLERLNDPHVSPWFKKKQKIFDDFLIIGQDNEVLFALSKKYDIDDPSVYLCKNTKSSYVEFAKINLNLESLIKEMIKRAFLQ